MSLHALPTRLLTRDEVAHELRISVRTFDQMRYDGRDMGFPMPEIVWGRRLVRFRLPEVEAWNLEFQRRRAA